MVSIVGVSLLFRAAQSKTEQWEGRIFIGAMLAGWGGFNFFEGLIDHQILGLHHVLPGHPSQFLFDMIFLGAGLLLVVVGSMMMRKLPPRGDRRA